MLTNIVSTAMMLDTCGSGSILVPWSEFKGAGKNEEIKIKSVKTIYGLSSEEKSCLAVMRGQSGGLEEEP